jgi:phage terminase large subunit-like protein
LPAPAVGAYHQHKADRIVAEGNQGGDLVRHTLATVSPNVPISIVHASRSKQARAEPVAALYEQRRVTHLAPFPDKVGAENRLPLSEVGHDLCGAIARGHGDGMHIAPRG